MWFKDSRLLALKIGRACNVSVRIQDFSGGVKALIIGCGESIHTRVKLHRRGSQTVPKHHSEMEEIRPDGFPADAVSWPGMSNVKKLPIQR